MLDDTLLEAFMKGFYGYGNCAAKYWFVGLEEGGGKTCDEVAGRLRAWNQHGRPAIDDIREFHRDAKLHGWFGSDSTIQPTWGPLARAVLVAKGREVNDRSILEYQRSELGAADGETAVIEGLPRLRQERGCGSTTAGPNWLSFTTGSDMNVSA